SRLLSQTIAVRVHRSVAHSIAPNGGLTTKSVRTSCSVQRLPAGFGASVSVGRVGRQRSAPPRPLVARPALNWENVENVAFAEGVAPTMFAGPRSWRADAGPALAV